MKRGNDSDLRMVLTVLIFPAAIVMALLIDWIR